MILLGIGSTRQSLQGEWLLICNDEEMVNVGTVALRFQAYGENPEKCAGECLMSSKVAHESIVLPWPLLPLMEGK